MHHQQRTSQTHPINLCTLKDIWPGTLSLTFAPGKVQKDAMTGTWNRSLTKDLQRIKNFYKIDVLVCLLQKQQMKQLKIPHLLTECEKIGIKTEWIQIQDNNIPQDEQKYKNLIRHVSQQYLNKGKNVVVHCKGGLGRAGTFAACCLIYNKYKPQDAIKLVRKTRSNTINCISQQQWLMHKLKF